MSPQYSARLLSSMLYKRELTEQDFMNILPPKPSLGVKMLSQECKKVKKKYAMALKKIRNLKEENTNLKNLQLQRDQEFSECKKNLKLRIKLLKKSMELGRKSFRALIDTLIKHKVIFHVDSNVENEETSFTANISNFKSPSDDQTIRSPSTEATNLLLNAPSKPMYYYDDCLLNNMNNIPKVVGENVGPMDVEKNDDDDTDDDDDDDDDDDTDDMTNQRNDDITNQHNSNSSSTDDEEKDVSAEIGSISDDDVNIDSDVDDNKKSVQGDNGQEEHDENDNTSDSLCNSNNTNDDNNNHGDKGVIVDQNDECNSDEDADACSKQDDKNEDNNDNEIQSCSNNSYSDDNNDNNYLNQQSDDTQDNGVSNADQNDKRGDEINGDSDDDSWPAVDGSIGMNVSSDDDDDSDEAFDGSTAEVFLNNESQRSEVKENEKQINEAGIDADNNNNNNDDGGAESGGSALSWGADDKDSACQPDGCCFSRISNDSNDRYVVNEEGNYVQDPRKRFDVKTVVDLQQIKPYKESNTPKAVFYQRNGTGYNIITNSDDINALRSSSINNPPVKHSDTSSVNGSVGNKDGNCSAVEKDDREDNNVDKENHHDNTSIDKSYGSNVNENDVGNGNARSGSSEISDASITNHSRHTSTPRTTTVDNTDNVVTGTSSRSATGHSSASFNNKECSDVDRLKSYYKLAKFKDTNRQIYNKRKMIKASNSLNIVSSEHGMNINVSVNTSEDIKCNNSKDLDNLTQNAVDNVEPQMNNASAITPTPSVFTLRRQAELDQLKKQREEAKLAAAKMFTKEQQPDDSSKNREPSCTKSSIIKFGRMDKENKTSDGNAVKMSKPPLGDLCVLSQINSNASKKSQERNTGIKDNNNNNNGKNVDERYKNVTNLASGSTFDQNIPSENHGNVAQIVDSGACSLASGSSTSHISGSVKQNMAFSRSYPTESSLPVKQSEDSSKSPVEHGKESQTTSSDLHFRRSRSSHRSNHSTKISGNEQNRSKYRHEAYHTRHRQRSDSFRRRYSRTSDNHYKRRKRGRSSSGGRHSSQERYRDVYADNRYKRSRK